MDYRDIKKKYDIIVSIEMIEAVGEKYLNKYFDIPKTEVYGERFDIPDPDTLVFLSSFEGGEVFRTGCCYRRGLGKIFYFRPGHETYPIFYQPEVQQIIKNSILWAAY